MSPGPGTPTPRRSAHRLASILAAGSCAWFCLIASAQPDSHPQSSHPAPAALTVEDSVFSEGSAGGRYQSFRLRLSPPSESSVSVEFQTEADTATAGTDFVPRSGLVTFPSGTTDLAVSVFVLSDRVAEGTETFRLVLSRPTPGVALARNVGVATILDDDLPAVRAGETYRVEGNEGPVVARLPLTLSNPSDLPVSVRYATLGESALPGDDFLTTQGTAEFPPGTITLFIDLPVLGDRLKEGHETFRVQLDQPRNAAVTGDPGRVIILDDDPMPAASITADPVIEGAVVGPTVPAAEFVIHLSNPSAQDVRLVYETRDDTARAGIDYIAQSSVVTIPAGQSDARITVPILDDAVAESDEVFQLVVTSTDGLSPVPEGIPVSILDDDQVPSVSVTGSSMIEGDGGGTNFLEFEVRLSSPPRGVVSVEYTTESSTATATHDFLPLSGKLTFAVFNGRIASHLLKVPIVADTTVEANETVTLRLSAPVDAVLGSAVATGTILNDDGPAVAIQEVSLTEPETGTIQAVLECTLAHPSTTPVTVNYRTVNGTATAPEDYQAAQGVVRFAPGETRQTISIVVRDDALAEATEFLEVLLEDPVGATLLRDRARVTVLDRDVESFSVNTDPLAEGSSGSPVARFRVLLSGPTFAETSVRFHTEDGTAREGVDYVPLSGTLVFPPGTTERVVEVPVVADQVAEASEEFRLVLTDPTLASIATHSATVTLLDDDPEPIIQVEDIVAPECTGQRGEAWFTLRLSSRTDQPVRVTYRTTDGTATGDADFTFTEGIAEFTRSAGVATIRVPLACDGVDEPAEFFNLRLADAENALLLRSNVRAQIIDSDPPAVVAEDASHLEDDAEFGILEIPLSLTSPTEETVNVRYTTAPGTATAGVDFSAASGWVVFPPSTTRQVLRLAIGGDSIPEAAEQFSVLLDHPSGASLARNRIAVTIEDNDLPELLISGTTVSEGPNPNQAAIVLARLSAPSPIPVTVEYSTEGATASAGQDFTPVRGNLAFPPGTTDQTFLIPILDDSLAESTESFLVRLSNPTNARIREATATVTLIDDERPPPPDLTVFDADVDEGDAGWSFLPLSLVLSTTNSATVSVDLATEPESATGGLDFISRTERVSFAPGIRTQTVFLTIVGDLAREPDETFGVVLSRPVNATLPRARAQVTIRNDDGLRLRVDDIRLAVSRADPTQAVFRVTLSEASTETITVDYATRDDSAHAGEDYIAKSGTLEFAPGETEVLLAIPIAANARDETEESFLVDFTKPRSATLARPSARATLVPALPSNRPPQVVLRSPTPPFTFSAASDVLVEVEASDPDQDALTVAFSIDGVPRFQLQEPPYLWSWTNATPGNHTLSVSVTDALGMAVAIPPVTLTIVAATNAPPVVHLRSPVHLAVHPLGDAISLKADAHDPEGAITQVEYFANQTRIAAVRAAPFELVWTNPPPGDLRCFARATDAQGATADSEIVVIGVTEVCGQVAILSHTNTTALRAMTEALFELGIPSRVFESSQVTLSQLAPFPLVVWNDDRTSVLTENKVRLVEAVAESGKNLYFIGDHLLADLATLDATGQSVWTRRLRLRPDATPESGNRIQFRHDHVQSAVEHPLLHGKAGSITDFDYPFPVQTTQLIGLGNELVLGERGGHPVLVAVASPDPSSGPRQITQAFAVGGEPTDSLADRKRLFQNAVWWLLQCPPCEDFNLVPTVRSSTQTPMAGQTFDLILEGTVSPDCDGLAGIARCTLPADWEVSEVRLDQGTWSMADQQITLQLGRLPRGSVVSAVIGVRPRTAGPQPVRIRWETLNETPATAVDNTLDAIVFVEDGFRLTLRAVSQDELELEILGNATGQERIETASEVSGPWTVVTNLPSQESATSARWRLPIDPQSIHRFFRAR